MSKPTTNIWCPHTMHPNKPIRNKAISIESRPNIINCVNLEIIEETKPKAGKIKIYTSRWPKNQNKCWNNSKSPPRKGSKKHELKCLSLIIIVIQAANTGIEITKSKDVKKIDQENNSIKLKRYNNEKEEILRILEIKFIEPKREDKPAKCNEKKSKSIEL